MSRMDIIIDFGWVARVDERWPRHFHQLQFSAPVKTSVREREDVNDLVQLQCIIATMRSHSLIYTRDYLPGPMFSDESLTFLRLQGDYTSKLYCSLTVFSFNFFLTYLFTWLLEKLNFYSSDFTHPNYILWIAWVFLWIDRHYQFDYD